MTRSSKQAAGIALGLAIISACAISPQARYDRYLARGKAQLEKHNYSRAILEFQNAAKLKPKEAEPYFEIGVASEGAGDIRSAVAFFRKALSENPKHSGAQLKLAQLMVLTNDKHWLQEAETRLNELRQGSPKSADVLNSLALTELKLGNVDAAAQDLDEVLANAPQELASSILLAQAKLRQNDVKGAEDVLKKACEADPKSAAPRVVLGQFYTAQKRAPEAEEQFQRALTLDPKNGLALVNLANLQRSLGRKQDAEQSFKRLAASGENPYKPVYARYLFEEGRREEAVREFERLAKESPDNRLARTQLVAAYRAVNRTADAQKVLDEALKRNPKDLDALLQRAEIFSASGKYSQAETDLNEVTRLRPNSAEVHYVRANLYRAWGQDLTYRQELSEALRLSPFLLPIRLELAQNFIHDRQPAAALETLDAAPADQKQLTRVIVQRNWALWASGDLAEMRKGIDQGLARERSADLLIQDGLCKLRTGNPTAARVSLEEALKINPTDLRALSGLSESYAAQKQTALALQTVEEYASRVPKSAPVQEFLGKMLLIHGDRDKARAAFMTAKSADPDFTDADYSLVQLDFLEGNAVDARKTLEAILTKHPGDKTAALWLGNLELMQGNNDAAKRRFSQVVESDPNNAQALNNLAYLLAASGGPPDQVLKYAQKAVELEPDEANYLDTLGWVLYEKGLYPSAVQYLERAVSHNGSAVSRYHLAMAYARAGNIARGRTTLAAALKINPKLPEAKTAEQLLEQPH